MDKLDVVSKAVNQAKTFTKRLGLIFIIIMIIILIFVLSSCRPTHIHHTMRMTDVIGMVLMVIIFIYLIFKRSKNGK